jgi:membrane associated rhomboid family serine protease
MRDLPPRRRAPAPAWTRPIAERLTPTIKALVIIQTVVYLFYAVVREVRPLFEAHLALGPGMLQGEYWQPLTSMFVHLNALTFVFNLIGLWFVGAFIERTIGARRFLTMFFTSGILAMVAMGLVMRFKVYSLGEGCTYAVLALFVAFGRMYNRAPAQVLGGLVMQARYLALILVGFAVVVDAARGDWASLAATMVASAVGFVLAGGGFRDFIGLWRARRLRRRYQVLDGGKPKGAKGRAKPGDQYWN